MFYCEFSGKLVQHGVSPVTVVLEKRPRVYENKVNEKIVTSYGWEIVKEIKVAPDEVVNCMNHYGLGVENE